MTGRTILGSGALALTVLLAACGSDEACDLQVLLTDAPGNFEQVPITVDGVQLRQATAQQNQAQGGNKGDEGQWVRTMSQTRSNDLLQLQDGKTALLGEAVIRAGSFDRVRMTMTRAQVVVAGQTHELEVPAGEGSGFELQFAFQAHAGESYELLLDLDAEQSITHDGVRYRFQPALSVKYFRNRNQLQSCVGTGCPGGGQ